jgi:hypothetical protein
MGLCDYEVCKNIVHRELPAGLNALARWDAVQLNQDALAELST